MSIKNYRIGCKLVDNAMKNPNWDGRNSESNSELCTGNCEECPFYYEKETLSLTEHEKRTGQEIFDKIMDSVLEKTNSKLSEMNIQDLLFLSRNKDHYPEELNLAQEIFGEFLKGSFNPKHQNIIMEDLFGGPI